MQEKTSEVGCALSVLHHIKDVNDTIELIDAGNKEETINKIGEIRLDLQSIKTRCEIDISSAEHKVGTALEDLGRSDRTGAKHWLLLSTDEIYRTIKDSFHGWG